MTSPIALSALYPSMQTVSSPALTPPQMAHAADLSKLYPSMTAVPADVSHEARTVAQRLYPTMADASDDDAEDAFEDADDDNDESPLVDERVMPEAHYVTAAQAASWAAQVNASPLAASVPAARAFLHEHAPKELITMLTQSGYGSHPSVVAFVADLAANFERRSGGRQ